MDYPAENRPQHGFSVATLLLLTAVVAIGLAAARTVGLQVEKLDDRGWLSPFEQRLDELAWRGAAGALVGMFVGIGVGATRPRPILGVLLAVPIGVLAGALTGAVITDPENVLLVAIGSALLILLGVVVRRFSYRPK